MSAAQFRVTDIKLRAGEELSHVFPRGTTHHIMAAEDVPTKGIWCKDPPICGFTPARGGHLIIRRDPPRNANVCNACGRLRPREET